MSDNEAGYNYKALAKKRMMWAIKPIAGVAIAMWILHPKTTAVRDFSIVQLQGFLTGALYGLIIYREELRSFLVKQRTRKVDVKNRVPEEYYMGHIEKVLRGKDEREI